MSTVRTVLRVLLALVMLGAGVSHFTDPEFFTRMVPPPLPPLWTTWLSGVAELLLAIGITVPKTRSAAGVALVVFFVAVLPANLYMALFPVEAGAADLLPLALWLRLPLQLVLMAWAWWCTRPAEPR